MCVGHQALEGAVQLSQGVLISLTLSSLLRLGSLALGNNLLHDLMGVTGGQGGQGVGGRHRGESRRCGQGSRRAGIASTQTDRRAGRTDDINAHPATVLLGEGQAGCAADIMLAATVVSYVCVL